MRSARPGRAARTQRYHDGKEILGPREDQLTHPGCRWCCRSWRASVRIEYRARSPAASPNPTEDLPQSPAGIGAILNDLHGFIAYGELILSKLASNPNFLAPTPGIIKLEDWLSYLTSRVFPDLGPFQSSGGTIAVKPPHFVRGPRLSVILRYLDCQAVREALQRLQSHLIELNKLDPIRPAPRPPTLNRRRPSPLDDADESWAIQMRSDEEKLKKREALGRDIVTEFDTFLERFRSLGPRFADRLLEGEESLGNTSPAGYGRGWRCS